MRSARKKNRQRLLWLGYNTDDVIRKLESISVQIAQTEMLLQQESDKFSGLIEQKLAFQEQLQQLLDKELAKERQLLEGITNL